LDLELAAIDGHRVDVDRPRKATVDHATGKYAVAARRSEG
jgi:hypothetical protein